MSAPATTASAHDAPHDHGHDESKFQIYVQIAMLLAVITGIEIMCVYLPFTKWILVTALVIFSAIKFLFVIFFFMHLRWDKPFCTILFRKRGPFGPSRPNRLLRADNNSAGQRYKYSGNTCNQSLVTPRELLQLIGG